MIPFAEIADCEKEALERYRPILLEELEINSILRGLLRERVLTRTLNFEVMKRPAEERVKKLLEILTSRGSRAFRGFCQVLKTESELELAYELRRAAYVKEEEILV